ncbi:unnamed protein product, partial [Rotaria sp. Silwood2]
WFGFGAIYANTFNFLGYVTDTTVQAKSFGVFYLAWTTFTIAMLIASIRSNTVLIVFFFFLILVYVLWTASYFQLWDQNLSRVGGAFGILTAAILWYIGFASLMIKGDNSYFELPVFALSPKSEGAGVEVHKA